MALTGPTPAVGRPLGGRHVERGAHLLGGSQTVLGCAQDAADETQLLQREPGHL